MHLQRFTCAWRLQEEPLPAQCLLLTFKTISDTGPHPQVSDVCFRGFITTTS